MKSIFSILLLTTFLAIGCNKKEKAEIARLNQENQSLKTQSQTKDSSINDILYSLNQIDSNLTVIKQKESLISMKSSGQQEMSPDVRARINEDIKIINELTDRNRKELVRLQKLLKSSNLKIGEFEKLVADLNTRINERENEIATLKEDLSQTNYFVQNLNSSIDTLRTVRTQLEATVENKTQTINTAYFIEGNKKQLIEDNVITKEGGIVGIGSAKVLNPDLDTSKFQKVDITEFTEIPVNSKKVEVVTTHPAGSYEFQKDDKGKIDKIIITNPEKFWSASKYLVVVY